MSETVRDTEQTRVVTGRKHSKATLTLDVFKLHQTGKLPLIALVEGFLDAAKWAGRLGGDVNTAVVTVTTDHVVDPAGWAANRAALFADWGLPTTCYRVEVSNG